MFDFDLRWIVVTFGLVLAGVTGCQIEDPAQEALDHMVAAACEQAELCRCGPPADSGACEARTATWKGRLQFARARGLIYQPSCVQAMEDNIVRLGCGEAETSQGHLCQSYCAVFHGEGKEGEACEAFDVATSDCGRELACVDGVCTTPCSALGGLAQGARCRDDNGSAFDDCAENLVCAAESGICETLPSAGDACDAGDCDTWSYCDDETRRCLLRQRVGSACASDSCERDAFCDFPTQTCARVKREGESCRDSRCADGLFCDPEADACMREGELGEPCETPGCVQGLLCQRVCDDDGGPPCRELCVEPAREGESCESISCHESLWCDRGLGRCVEHPQGEGVPCPGGRCDGDFRCTETAVDEGVCERLVGVGGACTGHLECKTSFCPAGFCVALPQEGDSCETLGSCGNGLTCDGAVCVRTVNRGSAVCSFEGW